MTAKKSIHTPSGAPATKWFITAASVAAMIGGWVGFSSQPVNGSDPTPQIQATSLELEPIPTVMPTPTGRRNAVQTSDQPANPQINQPVLRSVTAPRPASRPAPVTVTRSSK